MKPSSLTSRPKRVNGRLAHDYQHEGRTVTVWDSARNMLLVVELFADEELAPSEKDALLARMIFPDWSQLPDTREEYERMLDSVLWDACGLDISGTRDHEPKVFDWQQDAARIKASLRMAYGIDWDETAANSSYAEVCDLLSMLMEADRSTPFQEAVYYRSAKVPNGKHVSSEYRQAFVKRKQHFALRVEPTAQEQKRSDEHASDVFESLWRAANNG